MIHTSPDSRSPRPHADYRWTDHKALAFIAALAQHGKVAAAARAVGMTRQSAYRLKHRAPMIAEGWALAQAAALARRECALEARRTRVQGDILTRQGDAPENAR